MHFVYVLKSGKDGKFYVGRTNDLRARLDLHNRGSVESTKLRRPFTLIYFKGSNSIKDADRREKYLKSAWGKRYIKLRIKNDI